eukprot:9122445-Alexandrium_andersonii.AAC.1
MTGLKPARLHKPRTHSPGSGTTCPRQSRSSFGMPSCHVLPNPRTTNLRACRAARLRAGDAGLQATC